jgi:hypothetical protein
MRMMIGISRPISFVCSLSDNPVSRFVRSLLVSTATAHAEAMLAASMVASSVGVSGDHRDASGPAQGQVPVLLVPFHYYHRQTVSLQLFDDSQPDRSEPNDYDVVTHAGDAAKAECLDYPSAEEQVGDQGKQRRDGGGSQDYQDDGEYPELGRLAGEGEVPVPDGGDGLDGEIQRVEHREVSGVSAVGEAEHGCRHHDQHDDGGDEEPDPPAGSLGD